MADYQKMYHMLFNEITRTIENLQRIQQKTEEEYLNADDTPIRITGKEKEKS